MTRRHFAKCLAAGILGVPMLKKSAEESLMVPAWRSETNFVSVWTFCKKCDMEPTYIRIPNWFGQGKDAYFRTLNGMVREFETQMAKMFPEERPLKK